MAHRYVLSRRVIVIVVGTLFRPPFASYRYLLSVALLGEMMLTLASAGNLFVDEEEQMLIVGVGDQEASLQQDVPKGWKMRQLPCRLASCRQSGEVQSWAVLG